MRKWLVPLLLGVTLGIGSFALDRHFTLGAHTVPPSGADQAGRYLASTALFGAEMSILTLLSTAYVRRFGRD